MKAKPHTCGICDGTDEAATEMYPAILAAIAKAEGVVVKDTEQEESA